LLNGTFNEATGERLVLNVLETLTLLLEGNKASKVITLVYVCSMLSDVLISLGLSCLGGFQSASWCGLSNITELAIGLLQMVAK
jgi:hypothetical protein